MKPTLDVATLLRLQQLAYELVIEISRRSAENPQWLNLEVADQIKTPEGAEKWLASQAGTIDKTRFPEDELRRPFINLFSAFFNTSFHFDIRQYRDELISARIEPQFMRVGKSERYRVAVLALRDVAKKKGILVTTELLKKLAKQNEIRADVFILTYVWELRKRAVGKGKGIVAHQIWKALPRDIRKSLDENYYWLAKQRVVDALISLSQDG